MVTTSCSGSSRYAKGKQEIKSDTSYLQLSSVFWEDVQHSCLILILKYFHSDFTLISVYVVIISYAIVKTPADGHQYRFKKGDDLCSSNVPSFRSIFSLSLSCSKRLSYGNIHYLLLGFFSLLLLLVTIVFNRIKPHTERAVEHLLFKDRYDYRETLAKFSKAMVTILDLQSLSKRIIETITQTMGVEKASLFLWNEEKGGYSLFESKNIKMTASTPSAS